METLPLQDPNAPALPQRLYFERERGVVRIALQTQITHFFVVFDSDSQARRLALLKRLAADSVAVFLVKLHPDGVSFAVRKPHVALCSDCLAKLESESEPNCLRITRQNDLALVSPIAGAMRDLSGVIAQIYEALLGADIPVRQTGDAYNAVHCLVAGTDADRAAATLCQRFSLEIETGMAGE